MFIKKVVRVFGFTTQKEMKDRMEKLGKMKGREEKTNVCSYLYIIQNKIPRPGPQVGCDQRRNRKQGSPGSKKDPVA